MIKVNIKPLSVNCAWKGRRFKTPEYESYERSVLLMLPKNIDIPEPPYSITLEFGVSSKLSDWDNPIKPFQDILCKKYGIDDRDIYKGTASKVLVKKGEEFVKFKIE